MFLLTGSAAVIALLLVLATMTRAYALLIGRRHPPVGAFTDIAGVKVHYVHVPAPGASGPPATVFIHGASANLNDQMAPLRPLLQGRTEMLFFDRPGHGWSGRNGGHASQARQAELIAALMDRLGIGPAIVVGHSFGCSVAAAFALAYPERTRGLVFLSAATHPWPGGRTSWYYHLTSVPVVGWLFSETIASLAGMLRVKAASACVFAPNRMPPDYLQRARIPLVLRPGAFRANAEDVEGLYRFTVANAPRYREIVAPAIVVSGDADTVVYEEVHSLGLARDIAGAELVWIRNLGHKPDWVAPELVVAAIDKLSGRSVDLQAIARTVESRIADDAFGRRCQPTAAIGEPFGV